MKLKEVMWWSGKHTIGMVAYENTVGEKKIAVGQAPGLDEDDDIQSIMDCGSKINADQVTEFLKKHSDK